MTTFTDVLTRRIRDDPGSGPGRPLVTYYDLGTGERVELSVTTYANWVAKTASLMSEEHGLERGQRLRVDLPTHWLGPVFLGAAWMVGLVVTDDDEPDAVVCGPAALEHWAPYADRRPVLACSLLPLGVRFAEPLPAGVHDVGLEVWGQPDSFVAWDPPGPGDAAVDWEGRELSQTQLWGLAAAGTSHPGGGRVLSTANPASPSGLAAFTEPLGGGGSLVLVAGSGAPEDLARIAEVERVTLPGHRP
ncbi:TIGR03089 family protein [Nocardioides agariphilus]|uniref:TIGR03089 family protein n=1 Tax=Nocardioides agariphilus TaxID=433664 RepID=A0A930VM47_9ACTN|nr:TIGR03089 family protein [Nocardioides agariphilus]